MWPWEHLAFGYLLYSVYCHAAWRDGPGERDAAAVAAATLLPDLVDKPLGWWLGVLPGGRTFAHSLLVAVPAIVLVALVGWFLHAHRSAIGFAVGYLSHLLGDVVYPLVVKGELRMGFLLWPLTASDAGAPEAPFGHLVELLADFTAFLATPMGALYLLVEGLLVVTALVVWWRDGTPGLRWIRDGVRRSPAESP